MLVSSDCMMGKFHKNRVEGYVLAVNPDPLMRSLSQIMQPINKKKIVWVSQGLLDNQTLPQSPVPESYDSLLNGRKETRKNKQIVYAVWILPPSAVAAPKPAILPLAGRYVEVFSAFGRVINTKLKQARRMLVCIFFFLNVCIYYLLNPMGLALHMARDLLGMSSLCTYRTQMIE